MLNWFKGFQMLGEAYINSRREEKRALIEQVRDSYSVREKLLVRDAWSEEEMQAANDYIEYASWCYKNLVCA